MYCATCGSRLTAAGAPCPRCDHGSGSSPERAWAEGIRACPGCGHRGDGVPYFRRSGHAGLLVGATLFTYGLGGLLYWMVKRRALICPNCGLSWKRARPWPGVSPLAGGEGAHGGFPRLTGAEGEPPDPPLPGGGLVRRGLGTMLALLAFLLLGVGVVEGEAGLIVGSLFLGLTGAGAFAWGWNGRQERRETLLRSLERRTLRLARSRGGRLTATEVASELGLSIGAAEGVLFSLDDGFRVRSEVTDEGLLLFEFPELRVPQPGLGTRETDPIPTKRG